MIFGNQVSDLSYNIRINEAEVESVCENKFLGVIIDHKLNSHINYVSTKMSGSIWTLYKAQDLLNQKSQYVLCYSLIVPYVTHWVELWGNTDKTNTHSIFLLQTKIISQKSCREPTNPLFLQLNMFKFTDLVEYDTRLTMYRAKKPVNYPKYPEVVVMRDSQHNMRGTLFFKVVLKYTMENVN